MSTHRRRLAAGLLALTATLVAACGSDDGTSSAGSTGGAFPVTIEHAKGTTTIPRRPRRVVVAGYTDALVAQALGAHVVGAVSNPSARDGYSFPFVRPRLTKAVASLDQIHPDLERIAALRPDLILATSAQPGYATTYAKLAKIAPTISYRKQLLLDDPADLTRTIGRALGKPREAEQLIARGRRAVADYARRHPGLRGKTYAYGQVLPTGLGVIVGKDAISSRFFAGLGMRIPPQLARLARPGDIIGQATIPAERSGTLAAADVAFLTARDAQSRRRLTTDPVLRRTDLARDGDLHAIDIDTAFAIQQAGPANAAGILARLDPALRRIDR